MAPNPEMPILEQKAFLRKVQRALQGLDTGCKKYCYKVSTKWVTVFVAHAL